MRFRSKLLQPRTASEPTLTKIYDVQMTPDGRVTLRHSLASFLVRKGTDVKTVQRLLRHSDVTTTLGIYAHSMSEDRLAAQGDMLTAMMKPPSDAVN
jgi:site-specific recombinase XerC